MSWYNPYIVSPFAVWIIAQLAKFLLAAWRRGKRIDFRYLYASGGMPSAHSAVVCALAVTALLRNGSTSSIFGLTTVLAAIVMYDSFGVRRAAGEQAAAINAILEAMGKQRLGFDHPQQRLREILGHKPLEVTVGALAGVLLGLLFNASYLGHQIDWLTAFQTQAETIGYASAGAGIILLGLAASLWLRQRHSNSKVIKSLRRQIVILALSVGLAGGVLSFAGYQKALYLGWRLWVYLLAVIFAGWAIAIAAYYWQKLPVGLAQEAETARIGRWLPKKRRRVKKG